MPRPTKDGLYRDKSSPYWYCRWHDSNGDLHRRSTNQADSNAAMQVYNSLRIASNGKPDTATPLTVDTVLNIYHHERGHRLKGQKGYESSKVSLLNFWSGVKWAELSRKGSDKHIREYVKTRMKTCKAATVNRELNLLSAAAVIAADTGLDIGNPVTGYRPEEIRSTEAFHYLEEGQMHSLMAAIRERYGKRTSPHLEDYVIIAIGTGMRQSEILSLTTGQIHLQRREIIIYETKGGREHRLPMNDGVYAAILSRLAWAKQHNSAWLFHNPVTGERLQCIRGPFLNACRRAGIRVTEQGVRGIRLHDTRHTTASHLVQQGEPLQKVADLLNHRNIKTTQRYGHLAPDARRDTVSKLPTL